MARSKSSGRWLQRHVSDPYVKKARDAGYRSRAAYKLLEVNSRERLIIPGARVVDLGAAPGGWSQVAASAAGPRGRVVAIDLLEIAPISGVCVLRGDFREAAMQDELLRQLGTEKADLVLSDMSPNLSGIASVDQARAAELARTAMEFCRGHLAPQGAFFTKLFQGEEFAHVLKEMKGQWQSVKTVKPAASRDESRETYVLARGLRGGA
jgi:23S rRNA (uridine2552-2'-O)-methyltransferase